MTHRFPDLKNESAVNHFWVLYDLKVTGEEWFLCWIRLMLILQRHRPATKLCQGQ